MMKAIVVALAVFPLMSVAAAKTRPKDVAAFVQQRDACDHFRGEEPYDRERRAFLEARMRKLCTGSDAKLRMLKRKYATHQSVMEKLNQYEPKIEGTSP